VVPTFEALEANCTADGGDIELLKKVCEKATEDFFDACYFDELSNCQFIEGIGDGIAEEFANIEDQVVDYSFPNNSYATALTLPLSGFDDCACAWGYRRAFNRSAIGTDETQLQEVCVEIPGFIHATKLVFGGSNTTFTWEVEGGDDSIASDTQTVKLQLLNFGEYVGTITESAPNNGEFEWQVPADQPTGTHYSIRVTTMFASGGEEGGPVPTVSSSVVSDAFTIVGPTIHGVKAITSTQGSTPVAQPTTSTAADGTVTTVSTDGKAVTSVATDGSTTNLNVNDDGSVTITAVDSTQTTVPVVTTATLPTPRPSV